jgi:hypothetical protein
MPKERATTRKTAKKDGGKKKKGMFLLQSLHFMMAHRD